MTTRRKWAKPTDRTDRMATRDLAIRELLRCGFSTATIALAFGLSRRRAEMLVRQIRELNGGPIEAEPDLVAATDRLLKGLGLGDQGPLAPRSAPEPKTAEARIRRARRGRPGATVAELALAAGASERYVRQVLSRPRRSRPDLLNPSEG